LTKLNRRTLLAYNLAGKLQVSAIRDTFEQSKYFFLNLVWMICHLMSSKQHTFQSPMMSNKTVDLLTSEA